MTGLWAMLKLGVATAVGESRILNVNKTSLFDLQFENNREIDYPKFQNMVIYSQTYLWCILVIVGSRGRKEIRMK